MNSLGSKHLSCNCLSVFFLKWGSFWGCCNLCVCVDKKILHRTTSAIKNVIMINIVKTSGVILRSRQECIFPADATNISSFYPNVVNTKKFEPLLCWIYLARAENPGKITTVINIGVCSKVHGNNGKKHALQHKDNFTIALRDYFKALMSMGEFFCHAVHLWWHQWLFHKRQQWQCHVPTIKQLHMTVILLLLLKLGLQNPAFCNSQCESDMAKYKQQSAQARCCLHPHIP